VIVFDRGFHGRTNLTMAMTTKVHPYKHGFGPLAGASTARRRRTPPGRDRPTTPSPGLHAIFKEDVDPGDVACVDLEPVQGEGGFIPMPDDFPRRLLEVCDEHGILYVDDEVQAGHGPDGTGLGDRALRHRAGHPRVGQVARRRPAARGDHARAEIMDAPEKGGLGGTFGGNPLSCVAANAALDLVASPAFRERTDALGATLRSRLEEIAGRHAFAQEVRGLGPMLAVELDTRERAYATTQGARERGLILLSCGYDGNVIRILVPHVIGDEDLDEGLRILDAALAAA
jgi:4-aminobutyrate aminotransferase-like enzyme